MKTIFISVLSVLLGQTLIYAQNFDWATRMGAQTTATGQAIDVDAQGNVYTAGTFTDTLSFALASGNQDLISKGDWDIYISKQNRHGQVLWVKSMGGTQRDEIIDLVIDPNGAIYLAGNFKDTVDFDPNMGNVSLEAVNISSSSYDVFICKWTTDGNFVWVNGLQSTETEVLEGIAVDSLGAVYATGYYNSTTLDFDPNPNNTIQLNTGAGNSFIVKYDDNGNYVWAQPQAGSVADIGVDAANRVYVTGRFFGTNVDFDPGPASTFTNSAGSGDVYTASFGATGNFRWVRTIGSNGNDYGTALEVSPDGNIALTGSYNAWGTGLGNQLLVARINSNGGTTWANHYGDNANAEEGVAITWSQDGYTYISVSRSAANFYKIDNSGNVVWDQSIGGVARGMTSDAFNAIYTTGGYSGSEDFDPGANVVNLNSAGGAYTLKLNQCTASTASFSVTACQAYVSPSGKVWTNSNTYQDTIVNSTGCDSILTISVQINTINTIVQQSTDTLMAMANNASFQWLDCDNGYVAIAGATNALFIPSSSGNYAVEVHQNNCVDTSSCYSTMVLNTVQAPQQAFLSIFPNPTTGLFSLSSNKEQAIWVSIYSPTGALLQQLEVSGSTEILLDEQLPSGLYFIQAQLDEQVQTFKLVKY